MNFDEYQEKAKRTDSQDSNDDALMCAALGIAGEAGEIADYIKKYKEQGHPLLAGKIAEEMGDLLWYVAKLSGLISISLEAIAQHNVIKLQRRYPNGFSVEDSVNREIQDLYAANTAAYNEQINGSE